MPPRYRIGEFAALTGATVKRLRFYHERGLLVPAVRDPHTGYRYYTAAQVPHLHRIAELASLGLSLRDIRRVVDAGFAHDLVRELLLGAREENERQLAVRESRRRRIDAALRRTNTAPTPSFVIKRVAALRVASLRDTLRTFDDAAGLLEELTFSTRASHGLVFRGVLWHDCGKTPDRVIDCEAVASVARRHARRHDRASQVELPATTVVSVVHDGPDATVSESYSAAWDWLAEHGYALAAPVREWYWPTAPDEHDLLELHFPIAG